MNELIKFLSENGLSNTVYYAFHVLGFIAVFVFVVWYGKKIDIEWWKSVVTVLTVYPIIYGWMYVMFWIESGFTNWGGNNIVRVFVYVPLAGLPVAKLLKIEWKKMFSLLAFAPLIVHGVSHFGCIFAGCCNGYQTETGIYNPIFRYNCFPNQPIEALGAVLIVVYLIFRAKKRNYVPDGIEFPIMLSLFGLSRFLFEFLRDNEKIFFGCSAFSFHSLFMLAVGIIWIAIAVKKSKSELKIF